MISWAEALKTPSGLLWPSIDPLKEKWLSVVNEKGSCALAKKVSNS